MSDRRLALVVAIDRYDQPALHRLASPGADAEALADVLGDPELGGFEVDVLRNPTSSTLAERVERMLTERHPSDLVLLHFSGHGLKDDAGELHLAAMNTIPGLLGSTAVEAAWVSRMMQRSRAQRVVLLLDCCYGGAFERGLIRRAGSEIDVGDQFRQSRLGEGRGRVVITASTAMEYAFENAELADDATAGPSVFTGALVEGIRSGDADRNQDGQVSLGELYDYVYDRVRERTPHQTPSKWEFGLRGDLYVARNPHRRFRTAELAPELLDLIRHPLPGGRRAAVHELADIAAGDDLTRAAAARLHLADLAGDDSRAVSAEAAEALAGTGVRLAADTLDLGPATAGAAAVTGAVAVLGAPLVRTSAVTAEEPLRARLEGSTLRVTWAPGAPGALAATVTLAGPAGTAELRVTGHAAAPPARPVTAAPAQPGRSPATALATGGAAVVLVAALATAAVLTSNGKRDEPTTKGPAGPTVTQSAVPSSATTTAPTITTPTNYTILLTLLPDSLRADCTELTAQTKEIARASCGPGDYRLWKTEADLKADFDYGESPRNGSCAKPPADEHRIDATFPEKYRTGRLACWFFAKDADTEPFYVVEWALYGPRVTGTFASDDADPKKYPKLYADALAALKVMP